MKKMKRIAAITLSVLMLFAFMPFLPDAAGEAYAEGEMPEVTVTLDPGIIGGTPITYKNTDPGMMRPPEVFTHGTFEWDGNRLWYRFPDCPKSFSPPSGVHLTGWFYPDWNDCFPPGTVFSNLPETFTLTAQWGLDVPEPAYDSLIRTTISSDGYISGIHAIWKPVEGADGYIVQLARWVAEASEYQWLDPVDMGKLSTSADGSLCLDLMNDTFINRGGHYKVRIRAYKDLSGVRIESSDLLESEEFPVSCIDLTGTDGSLVDRIYVGTNSEGEWPNTWCMIRDHWADQYLRDGVYVNEDGEELFGVTAGSVTLYSGKSYQYMCDCAYFLTKGDVKDSTIPSGETVYGNIAWKSDLAYFCGDAHQLSYCEAVPATVDADGHLAGYECAFCGRHFEDEQGNEEIQRSSWVIPTPKVFKLGTTSYTYNGKAKEPTVTVTDRKGNVIDPANYGVTYVNNVKAGTAKATVTFKGERYEGTKSLTFKINKAANPMTVKGRTATVKKSKVRKKTQTLAVSKVLTVSKKQGTVTYAKKSGNKKITINKTTGKVKVKKGLKKGTYKVKVAVTASGNSNYNKVTKTVTFKVRVK